MSDGLVGRPEMTGKTCKNKMGLSQKSIFNNFTPVRTYCRGDEIVSFGLLRQPRIGKYPDGQPFNSPVKLRHRYRRTMCTFPYTVHCRMAAIDT